jgi:proteasome lid subunit RPN8/RPN11
VIQLSEALLDGIRQHGAREFPCECCGAILGDVDGQTRIARELRPLENVHEEGHERRYLVAPARMFELIQEERRTGRKLLGFYHSHPDHPARPSGYDRDHAMPWYTYVIVAVMEGRPGDLTAWRLQDDWDAFVPEAIEVDHEVCERA